jgi:hypothetical protein
MPSGPEKRATEGEIALVAALWITLGITSVGGVPRGSFDASPRESDKAVDICRHMHALRCNYGGKVHIVGPNLDFVLFLF